MPTSGRRPAPEHRPVLDGVVWVVFALLFVGAALVLKVFAVLVVVLLVLAVGLGLTLRLLRRSRR
ncbi:MULTISPECIES: hypothetical protein [unclassified Curtobacterium]|uniref:hypothetical protein n=1 Tax=unclassified Curtobacterium TaxID=257496 RepID=UPI000DA7FB1C|nr:MULTISPECIES: hypothetical protein [unclassified Curtobacterium]PZE28060.1 hypothetical protein DEI86_05590 [Curtobacterium sp. MCBD17_028]PZE72058.1 hypothetical protein DEI82_14775 [Curtobacterium sp. MCBD17_019]PZF62325.1 hypothetical protein DEI92_02200 [Curtobacterium sp. MCBD17_034]PZM39968.1 hypothetical protein DEI90_03905 [Curtobacterium sp. MCBD17_031]WIB63955.1 hypothetical protein DEI94_01815 [Curtobacterium sp. MCBD17_040]